MNLLTNWYVTAFAIGFMIGSVISQKCRISELRTSVRMMNERIEHLECDMNRPISIEDISTTNDYVIVGRDPLDNMPMIGIDKNGAICPL